MDPQANLKEQAELSAKIIELIDGCDEGNNIVVMSEISEMAERLAELSSAYCEWISKGGACDARR